MWCERESEFSQRTTLSTLRGRPVLWHSTHDFARDFFKYKNKSRLDFLSTCSQTWVCTLHRQELRVNKYPSMNQYAYVFVLFHWSSYSSSFKKGEQDISRHYMILVSRLLHNKLLRTIIEEKKSMFDMVRYPCKLLDLCFYRAIIYDPHFLYRKKIHFDMKKKSKSKTKAP